MPRLRTELRLLLGFTAQRAQHSGSVLHIALVCWPSNESPAPLEETGTAKRLAA
jgi:hypothetical protein